MTSVALTALLMMVLLIATVIGAGIGACLWHWRTASRFDQASTSVRRSAVAQRKAYEGVLSGERKRGSMKQLAARDAVALAQAEAQRWQEQHESLLRHAQAQSRRIDELESEVLAFEGQLRSDGDPPAAPRVADDAVPRVSPPLSSTGDHPKPVLARRSGRPGTDLDLPVLNRRVAKDGSVRPATAAVADTDTPSLAESTLPQDADSLSRDLLTGGDRHAGRDD